MERRLAAILAADMVGYSRLMAADEAGTIARLKAHRGDLIDPKIADYGGRIVKTTGDGLLVEFPSVVDAVQCAVDIQREMPEREAGAADAERISYRIGINLGDIVIDGDDILGDGVNVAARLEGIAAPGGVCISDMVHENIAAKLDLKFEDGGERTLKNIDRKVRAWHWAAGGLGPADDAAPVPKVLALPDKPSIAVLPFENMSGDSAQAYFSDGMTEEIITELSRFRSLFVIGRNSSFAFRGQAVDLSEIGRRLGVQYIIEGSVRRAGERVRITAQLIEADSGSQLWAERFDRGLEDVFAVQEEVSRTIVATLVGRVERDRLNGTRAKGPDNLAAYDYFLRGKARLVRYTGEDVLRARDDFQNAIDISPDYAEAYAWLSQCHSWQYAGWWSKDPDESLETSVTLARKALEMDPTIGQAHGSLAYALVYKREHRQALHHFERAIALVPCDAENTANYGWCLMFDGRRDEGLSWIEKGERLNPLQDWWYPWLRGMAHYTAGRYDAALDAFDQLPSPPAEVEGWRAACYAQMGESARAKEAVEIFQHRARTEFAINPADAPGGWRRYWMSTEPFRRDEDQEHLLEGLRRSGLAV